MYSYLILLHVLGACIWTGGHIILATCILPRTLKERSARDLLRFESAYEKIGIPGLLVQVITGIWLAYLQVPDIGDWFETSDPVSRLILLKLGLLAVTAVFAADARFRLIPRLTDDKLRSLALHIVPVTLVSILFVVVGVAFRSGGWF